MGKPGRIRQTVYLDNAVVADILNLHRKKAGNSRDYGVMQQYLERGATLALAELKASKTDEDGGKTADGKPKETVPTISASTVRTVLTHYLGLAADGIVMELTGDESKKDGAGTEAGSTTGTRNLDEEVKRIGKHQGEAKRVGKELKRELDATGGTGDTVDRKGKRPGGGVS